MIDPSHKYADINTKIVDSVLCLTLKKVCLPKEMKLKEGVKYRPGPEYLCDEYSWVYCLDVYVRW